MYTSIYGSVCFQRLNATHSTECGSSHGGSVGASHLIETQSDSEFSWNKPPATPYTLIVPPLFNRENILEVADKAKSNIAGIVLPHGIQKKIRIDVVYVVFQSNHLCRLH